MDAPGKTGQSTTAEAAPPGGARAGTSAHGASPSPTAIPPENPATGAATTIPVYLAEIKAYAAHFLSAKIDGVRSRIRSAMVYAAMGVVGLLAAAGIVFTAVFLLISGLAMGLGHLLGGRLWLGNIVVGALVLGGIGLGAYIAMSKLTKASRLKTEQKYEGKRIQQRVEFGRDVRERAGRR